MSFDHLWRRLPLLGMEATSTDAARIRIPPGDLQDGVFEGSSNSPSNDPA